MMANTSCLECRTGYFLLLLVATGLSILPSGSSQYCNMNFGEPLIEISSTSPSNQQPIGASINLTCTAWQTDELAMKKPKTRPHRIEWFDPQGQRIGDVCQAESPAAARINCTLMVGALTEDKFGNYTCKASNGYNYCSNKRFHIGRQGEPLIKISSTPPSNELPIGASINLTCTAWQTDDLAMKKPRTRPHRIEWFDPQGRPIGDECQAESPAAARMNCPLMVDLTEGKFGNYTCKAINGYNDFSNKRFPIICEDIPAVVSGARFVSQ